MAKYKVVPAEPTPEMEQAAEKYWNDRKFKALSGDPRTWKGLYETMCAAAPAVQGEPDASLPPFAIKVIEKLLRFNECVEDGQGADIGSHWFDILTRLGLLNRVQRSPALWELSQQGDDLIEAYRYAAPQPAEQKPAPDVADYEQVLDDHRRLTRELDVLLNGEEGAAQQASLADLVAQLRTAVRTTGKPVLAAPDVSGLVDALEEIRGLPSVRQDEAAFIAESALATYRNQGGES